MAERAVVSVAPADSHKPQGSKTSRPRPQVGLRLLLATAGLILPLALLEGLFRLAGPALPGEYQTASFLETHPEFARRNRPGQGWKRTSEFTTWIEINSKGLRGPEIDYVKAPGEVRILILGDSFTFAEQVEQHQTYVQLLEDRLNSAPGGTRFRVLNAGSNGWATANQLIFLAEEGLKYQPDLVVLGFFVGNDVEENYRRVSTVRQAEESDLALRGADAFEGPRRLLRRSVLYTVFESGVLAKLPWWASDPESDATLRPPPRTSGEAQRAWSITSSLLNRMRQVAESRGAKLAVMMIPAGAQVGAWAPRSASASDERDNEATLPGFEHPQATLGAIGDRLGLAMLDLLPAFLDERSRSPSQVFYYPVARHWTPASHALAAEQLHEYLKRSRLLSEAA